MNDRHSISPYPIRMSQEMRDHLEESARKGGRSLHAEIMQRLDSTIALDDFMAERKAGTYAEVYDMLQSVWADNDRLAESGEQTLGNAYAIIDKLLDDKLAVMFAILEREEIIGRPPEQRITAREIREYLNKSKPREEQLPVDLGMKHDPNMKIATTMEPIKKPVRGIRRRDESKKP